MADAYYHSLDNTCRGLIRALLFHMSVNVMNDYYNMLYGVDTSDVRGIKSHAMAEHRLGTINCSIANGNSLAALLIVGLMIKL